MAEQELPEGGEAGVKDTRPAWQRSVEAVERGRPKPPPPVLPVALGLIALGVAVVAGWFFLVRPSTPAPVAEAAPVVELAKEPYVPTAQAGARLCGALITLELATECDVSAFRRQVDARMTVNPGDASLMCKMISQQLEPGTFADHRGQWKLRIFSPFSGDHPIAMCNLQ